MFEIDSSSKIIENVISLSKESFFHPFRIEFSVMYQFEKEVHYIKDDRNNVSEYLEPGPILEALLSIITEEKITEYPYEHLDFNEGSPIDEVDFFLDSNGTTIETTPSFMRYLREQNYIEESIIYDETVPEDWVSAPHLTKLQLTLEKASDLSTISFQFFSRYSITLMSLVSERDLMGTNKVERINLNNATLSMDGDTATVILGRPIYTKRLTLVIGQFNADDNTYGTERGIE